MWLIIAFLATIIGGALLLAGFALVAGIYYGESRARARWIVAARRAEVRIQRELSLWQNKTLERSGAGPLIRQPNPEQPQPKRRIVSPSTVISDMREKEQQYGDPNFKPPVGTIPIPVPDAIKSDFLKDAATAAHTNTSH
jgi:hypothetical protein